MPLSFHFNHNCRAFLRRSALFHYSKCTLDNHHLFNTLGIDSQSSLPKLEMHSAQISKPGKYLLPDASMIYFARGARPRVLGFGPEAIQRGAVRLRHHLQRRGQYRAHAR